jgi:predicted transglutaminase-like cysteine proteinase
MFRSNKNGAAKLFRDVLFVAALVAGTSCGGAGNAAVASTNGDLPGMHILSAAKAPLGYIAFCKEHAPDCRPDGKKPVEVVLTTTSYDQLVEVDDSINHRIKPATDMEVYGVPEKWEYPVDRGDCEDYVLLKRKTLLDAGWPQSALLITVVLDTHGEGHAVLTVVTNRGDYILDNLTDKVLPWQETAYRYVKRQSQYDEQNWVYLGPADSAAGVATAK